MSIHQTASRTQKGKVGAGLILLSVGVLLLLHQLGFNFPAWLISWPMLLIALGLITIVKHGFKHPVWIFFIGAGGIFMLDRVYPEIGIHRFIWPVVLIGVGLWVIFGKHRPWTVERWEQWKKERGYWDHYEATENKFSTDNNQQVKEVINSTCVFGGTKKTILSKNFTGGEVVTFLGGAEINLNQSDIQGKVKLEITAVMGGVKLIVPSHWHVITDEMVAVFGGIEDKRIITGLPETDKVLELTGTSVFGGIEIHNYV